MGKHKYFPVFFRRIDGAIVDGNVTSVETVLLDQIFSIP